MSQISQKSISGITSITSPAGIDDQISLHTSNTNEALKIDGAGNLHLNNHVNTTGVTTASNFKTGASNLHSTGLNVGDTFVHSTGINGSSADIDDFISVGNNIHLGNAGVITATSFVGDGSDLTNLPAGLGTALSATATSPLNKMYYTNQVLGVPSSVTVDVPASASKAYTQYADIKVESSADLIIAEGDDLIPDVLGLADFGTFGGGASAGRIRVNSISNAANDGSPTVQKGLVVTGVCTATSFSGGTATFGGDVSIADKIVHTGDENTSIRFPSADTIRLETGGATRLTLDSNGNTLVSGGLYAQGDSYISDSIIHDGDTNTKIRFPAADTFTVETNNTERFRIGSNGYIGVGNFSSKSRTDPLNVDSGIGTCNIGGNYIHLKRYSGGGTNYINAPQNNANLYISADDHIVFGVDHSSSMYSHNTEAFRIDSSGRLLIGATATDNRDGFNSAVQIGGTSGDGASICIGRYSANVSSPNLVLSKSRSATVGGHTRVNTGDYLGGIQFQGDDGTRFLVGASIVAQAASPVADYDMATDLVISTNYGTTSPSKSMTFDHQGRLTKPNTPFVMATINTRTNWNTTGSFMIIPWDTIHARSTSSNVGSHFNTSNSRFTAPVDGRYLFVLSMNIVGDNIIKHRINGADVSGGEYRMTQIVWDHADMSFIYDMNANDYYETFSRLYDSSGYRWNGGNNNSFGWDTLSIYLLG